MKTTNHCMTAHLRSVLFTFSIWLIIIWAVISPSPIRSQNIDNGIVAHWTFDQDADNMVHDSSPNRLHGTAYHVSYADGPVSRAMVFNGVNSRVVFPVIDSAPPDTLGKIDVGSISLWFAFINRGGDILPMIYYGESASSKPHNSLIIEIGHNRDPYDRRLYFTIIVAPFDVTRFCFDSGMNLEEHVWYHFVAVVGPDGNTGYLDGKELTARRYNLNSNATYTDFFSSVTSRQQLSLGYGRYGRDPLFYTFEGALDDVRIYNRPLGEQEVKALYALGKATDIIDPTPRSEGLNLKQNYPNPFADKTTIRWSTGHAGVTLLDVFDINGRLLTSMVHGFSERGSHEMQFDGSSLAPGVYVYRLQVGQEMAFGTMILAGEW